ncbi:type II CAAX prenyl endopeptidase Rce1 family protein [Hathewaya histolytica]|uniref:CPBP family glutamic-type intramembrane protease n=1 Tax=Hathewaya histolytica TaxID=1498 RepID=UPI003B67733F
MLKKLIKFNPTKDTGVAFICGVLIIILSLLMNFFKDRSLFHKLVSVLFRDILMILTIGFGFVLYYVLIKKRGKLSDIEITQKKLLPSLILNVIFGICLLFMFMSKSTRRIIINYSTFCAIVYIFVAGIFEMVFIYGFLRCYFEKAFGIIPSIFLTSIFYSLHHVGFQPEFMKLFLVGVMYASVIYITRNIFIIFPVFWGVGATWDVLINSTVGSGLTNTFSLVVSLGVLICMILYSIWIKNKKMDLERK